MTFCGPCAREQEAYFAIGELTQGKTQGLRSEQLAEVLERVRQERAGSRESTTAEMHHGLLGVYETKPLALRNS